MLFTQVTLPPAPPLFFLVALPIKIPRAIRRLITFFLCVHGKPAFYSPSQCLCHCDLVECLRNYDTNGRRKKVLGKKKKKV